MMIESFYYSLHEGQWIQNAIGEQEPVSIGAGLVRGTLLEAADSDSLLHAVADLSTIFLTVTM